MREKKNVFRLTMLLCMLTLGSICLPLSVQGATASGAISSLTNVSSGMKISWTRDSAREGYYIYRKTADTSYSQIKKITSNATLKYTDTTAVNGVKYTYKVVAYKGSRKASTTKSLSCYRLNTPSISSLSSKGIGEFTLKSTENAKASGYEIRYSTSSSFSSYKSLLVSGTKLSKTVTGLTKGQTYYVKIRAYKKASDKKYYSAYTAAQTVKIKSCYTAYISKLTATVYVKADSSSATRKLFYMDKISVYGNVRSSASGAWKKIKYNGSTYYMWVAAGDSKFTKTPNPYNYDDEITTSLQREVVDECLAIFKRGNTEYAHDQSDGKLNANGKYGYDCSGLAAYVMNKVMQKTDPAYRISSNIEAIATPTALINPGYKSEFKSQVVCSGKLDLSKLKPGDLVFFNQANAEQHAFGWNHCGIYLGKGDFIQSTRTYDGVKITPFIDSYVSDFVKAVRVIPDSCSPINKTMTTVEVLSVYPSWKCQTAERITKIGRGNEVTLLWTAKTQGISYTYGYVRYDNGKYGFVQNPGDKLQ